MDNPGFNLSTLYVHGRGCVHASCRMLPIIHKLRDSFDI